MENLLEVVRHAHVVSVMEAHNLGHASDAMGRWTHEMLGEPKHLPTRVSWFHITRAEAGTTFADGILPLTLSLPRVWDMMSRILAGTDHEVRLRELQASPIDSFQYNLKAGDPVHGGPFAMLIREAAFRAEEAGNWDYLRLPEIVADICEGYRRRYGIKITGLVSDRLSPCIVKFWTDYENPYLREKVVNAALYYLHLVENGESLTSEAGWNFDGQNAAIPPGQITAVYWNQAPTL